MSDKIEITLHSNHKDIEKGLKELAENAKNKRKILRELGHTVVNYIDETFETEGKHIGNKWVDWSDYYKKVRQKMGRGEGGILSREGELRESIDYSVNGDSVIIGTNKVYAAIHNFGSDGENKKGIDMNIPKRTFMEFTDDLEEQIITTLWGELKIDEAERQMDARLKELKGE